MNSDDTTRVLEELAVQAKALRVNGWHKDADDVLRKMNRILRRAEKRKAAELAAPKRGTGIGRG